MFRNKKYMCLFLAGIMLFATGCKQSDKADSEENIVKTEYLNLDALKEKNTDSSGKYQVLTLEKGTFEEPILGQSMEWTVGNVPEVRMELQGETVTFGDYNVWMFEPVEKGDVLATVNVQADEIDLKQKQIKLQRLIERYDRAKTKNQENLEELLLNRSMIYNDYQRSVVDIQYKQAQLDFAKQERQFQYDIQKAQEEVDKIVSRQAQQEILSPRSGFVFFQARQTPGKELKDEFYVCSIVSDEDFYLTTDQLSDIYGYGMSFAFSNGVDKLTAHVASGGSKLLYGNLDDGKNYFMVDSQSEGMNVEEHIWGNSNSMKISGAAKKVENVIVIPKKAVTVEDNHYYVTVKKQDGSLLKTEFIPGGSNNDSYWVYKGLTEGMEILCFLS